MRFIDNQPPLNTPKRVMAVCAYSEHVGVNRQFGPKNGLTKYRYKPIKADIILRIFVSATASFLRINRVILDLFYMLSPIERQPLYPYLSGLADFA